MENHTGDLRAKEKRPNFTKDMKEELGFSEKILAHLKEDKDVRRAAPRLVTLSACHACMPRLHVRTISEPLVRSL